VIGAAGFIGTHLCRQLAEAGAEVLAVSRRRPPEPPGTAFLEASLADPETAEAVAGGGFDQVHLLAGTALVGPSLEDPAADLRANAGDLVAFLEAMRRRGATATFVHVSSAAVYGEPASLPVGVDAPTRPVSPYGVSKLAGELYARLYSQLFGLRTVAVRPFSVYGSGLRKQVVWDILARLDGAQPAGLRGSGRETRDFVHVADVCSALRVAAERGRPGAVYNVCGGVETSIAELADRLRGLVGGPPLSFSGEAAPGNPQRWRGDPSELEALGWQRRIGLEEGLAETAAWFRATRAAVV